MNEKMPIWALVPRQLHHILIFLFSNDLPDGVEYQVVGDLQKLLEAEKEKTESTSENTNGDNTNGSGNGVEGKFHEM